MNSYQSYFDSLMQNCEQIMQSCTRITEEEVHHIVLQTAKFSKSNYQSISLLPEISSNQQNDTEGKHNHSKNIDYESFPPHPRNEFELLPLTTKKLKSKSERLKCNLQVKSLLTRRIEQKLKNMKLPYIQMISDWSQSYSKQSLRDLDILQKFPWKKSEMEKKCEDNDNGDSDNGDSGSGNDSGSDHRKTVKKQYSNRQQNPLSKIHTQKSLLNAPMKPRKFKKVHKILSQQLGIASSMNSHLNSQQREER